jgi:hypothetical protein
MTAGKCVRDGSGILLPWAKDTAESPDGFAEKAKTERYDIY